MWEFWHKINACQGNEFVDGCSRGAGVHQRCTTCLPTLEQTTSINQISSHSLMNRHLRRQRRIEPKNPFHSGLSSLSLPPPLASNTSQPFVPLKPLEPNVPTSRCVNAVPSMRMNRPPSPSGWPDTPKRAKSHGATRQARPGTRKRGSRRGQFNLHRDLIGPCTSSFFSSSRRVPQFQPQPARPSLPLPRDRTL